MGGFQNLDKPGQGEGVVWKSDILADVLSRWPLIIIIIMEYGRSLNMAD